MNTAVRLGRIRGVEVIADISVFVVAGLLGWLQALNLDREYDAGTVASLLGVVAAASYIGTLLLHEASHTWVAANRGLVPRRIRLLIFGGYSVIDGRDVNPANEFWVAMAGPIASLLAGAALWGLAWVSGWSDPLADTLRLIAIVNVLIGAFNVLPGLPLDGGRALRAVVWNLNHDRVRAARIATIAGRVLGAGVAVIGLIVLLSQGDLGGFVWMLLGWFLFRSATAAGKREQLIALAAGSTARDVMHPTPDPVPGTMRVAEVTALFQVGPTMRALPVEVGGRITGIIGQAEVERLAPARRELGRAASVMTPIGPGDLVGANTPTDALVSRLPAKDRLLVVDDGVVVGVIEARDLVEALG